MYWNLKSFFKNRILLIFSLFIIFCCFISSFSCADVAIRTAEDLQNIQNNLSETYYLENSIDCSETASWNEGKGFMPIGRESPFTGQLNGNGCTIRNLTINRPEEDRVGLFASIENAVIKDINFHYINIQGLSNVGSLAGYASNSTILHCAVLGSIKGAGIKVGGLIGECYNGKGIEQCAVQGTTVRGNSEVGGLVGRIWDGTMNTILKTQVFADISGDGDSIGGIAGYSKSGDLMESFSVGTVSGGSCVGGVVGRTLENAGIHNCHSSCEVTGTDRVGGIAGEFNSYDDGLSHCFFSGKVTGNEAGAFIGYYEAGTLSSSFWDMTLNPEVPATGNGHFGGILGKTTEEMQDRATYSDWDFLNIWDMNGYPQLTIYPDFPMESLVYQNFEENNGTEGDYGWSWGNGTAGFSSEEFHNGERAWKFENLQDSWNGTAVQSRFPGWNTDFTPHYNDRIVFWVKAFPVNNGNNTVGIKFFDKAESGGNYSDGVVVWTRQQARYGKWTELSVLFSQLPSDFKLAHVDKLEFSNYWPGTYYYDDIRIERRDRDYQNFEHPELLEQGSPWCWNGNVEVSTEKPHDGVKSLKLTATAPYAGTGFNSQHESYTGLSGETALQSPWNVDLNPEVNDTLSFWFYSLADNQMDNPVEVQFFDHGNYHDHCAKILTKGARYNEWTRLMIPFSRLPSDFNLKNIDKIQFLVSWPGTYYLDTIKAVGSVPKWDKSSLRNGLLKWNPCLDVSQYNVYKSKTGLSGDWLRVDADVSQSTEMPLSELNKTFYKASTLLDVRLSSNEVLNLFNSESSEVLEYDPPAVLLNKAVMKNEGLIRWNEVQGADSYDVDYAATSKGPWQNIYSGPNTGNLWLPASANTWYKVRASKNNGEEKSPWSPALCMDSPVQKGFLKTSGKNICDSNGKKILLRGFNLGSLLLNEPWMTGIGDPDNFPDEYSIRNGLEARGIDSKAMMSVFQNSFLRENEDLDILMHMGVNLVRLPVYYRVLMNEDGSFIPGGFEKMDCIIQACANRGIYVLIDLHGAPGAQSVEFHTGRKEFNHLFDPARGVNYRNQTVQLWKEIANHYKDESVVLGYDLLNEPTGVFSYYPDSEEALNALWDFYHTLYSEIRAVDQNHVIVMEAVWDWNTLPPLSLKNWKNVIYQFHYYNMLDELGQFQGNAKDIFDSHKAFLDQKLAELLLKQNEYNVPVMVGEFSGMGVKAVWEYYLEKFNELGLSWTLWSYKVRETSNWGIFSHTEYNGAYPDFSFDDEALLSEKLSRFNTLENYSVNQSLKDLITLYLQAAPDTSDLLVHYSFENEQAGVVLDQSGNGYTGSIIGSPSYEAGISDQAMNFKPGQLVRAQTNPLAGISRYTLSIWFKTANPANNYKLASAAWWHGGYNASGWNLGTHYPEGWADNQAGDIFGDSLDWKRTENFIPGEWNHLSVTCDGEKVKEYINGKLSRERKGSGLAIGVGMPMEIAAWSSCGFNNYDGLIDEFRIYNRALSSEEISNLYNEIIKVPNQPPVAVINGKMTYEADSSEGTLIRLDGGTSFDPDQNDQIRSWIWQGPFGEKEGALLEVSLPLGRYPITLKVSDGNLESEIVSVNIEVLDTVAPVLTLLAPEALSYGLSLETLKIRYEYFEAVGIAEETAFLNGKTCRNGNVIALADYLGKTKNIFKIKIKDLAGNSAEKEVIFSVKNSAAEILKIINSAIVNKKIPAPYGKELISMLKLYQKLTGNRYTKLLGFVVKYRMLSIIKSVQRKTDPLVYKTILAGVKYL